MADLGLLSGLAQGLKEGLGTYVDTKRSLEADALRKRMAQAQLMGQGLQEDQSGQLTYTPEQQAIRQAGLLKAQRDVEGYNPESQYSKSTAGLAGKLLQSAGVSGVDTTGMTAADLNAEGNLVKAGITGGFGAKGREIVANRIGAGIDVKKDAQTEKAVNDVVNDKQLGNHIQRIQGANRILSQIDDVKKGKIVDTNQLLNDINTEYVALLTGSQNPALGKQERTEYTTAKGNTAAFFQKLLAQPQSVNSPAIIQQLETQVKSLEGNYRNAVNARAQLLQRNYKHNPDATAAQQAKIDEMTQQYGSPGLLQGGQSQGLVKTSTDQKNKPKTVIQNGHTYILNPATGNYE